MHASFICNNGTVEDGFTALFTFAAEHFVICISSRMLKRVTRRKPMDMKKADDDKRKFDNDNSVNWNRVYFLGVLTGQYPVFIIIIIIIIIIMYSIQIN